MEKKRTLPFDVIMALVMMAIVTAIAIDGILIQHLPKDALTYPIFCFIVFYAACLTDIWNSFRKQDREKKVHGNIRNFYITLLMFVCYAALTYLVGFIVASIALTVAFTLYFRMKRPVIVNICAAVVIITLYFIFSRLLYIFLPTGVLFRLIF
ncbi:MAG: tripartite tricarboxylate transporter TctB family protein [Bullifex sp.]